MDTSDATAWVDPFVSMDVDCVSQTGADWYRLAVAASYGGKAIHGLNATPSCEVLTKQTEAFAQKYAVGRIRFDGKERAIQAMGEDVTERPYSLKDFKGIRSGTGAFFAFDQGLWEPSKRKRAREAALLAASLAAASGDRAGACEIVGKITSDEVDPNAVDIANIPISHMRRDVVGISKSAHKVFSCGTIQRALLWEDEQILAEKFPEVAAVDWGRATAIARYIAEANAQVDPAFRNYAASQGVPYALVKGCWAHVAFGDYILKKEPFDAVPTIDLDRLKVPRLGDAYQHSAESMIRLCYVNLNRLAYGAESVDTERLLAIVEGCKLKVRGSSTKRTRWTETEVLAGPVAHGIDTQAAARATAQSATAWNALVDAVTVILNNNQDAMRFARRVVALSSQNSYDNQVTDKLTKTALTNTTWNLAATYLAEALSSVEVANTRMAKLKRTTFGFSGALYQNMTITARMAMTARPQMVALAKKAVLGQAPILPKYNPYTTMRAMIGAHRVRDAALAAVTYLNEFRQAWVDRYAKWESAIREQNDESLRTTLYEYAMARVAFQTVDASTVANIATRFIDPKRPQASYVYAFAKEYAASMGIHCPRLKRAMYENATEVAEELDRLLGTTDLFAAAERETYTRLAMLAKDFGVTADEVFAAEEQTFKAKTTRPAPIKVGDLMMRMNDKSQELLAQLSGWAKATVDTRTRASYDAVLNTYDISLTADKHAIANGYENFEEAYSVLKDGARFDSESEYTQKGQAYVLSLIEAHDDGMILA